MKKDLSLTEKAQAVFDEADKQAGAFFTREVKEALNSMKEASTEEKPFSLTSGDINAYLG